VATDLDHPYFPIHDKDSVFANFSPTAKMSTKWHPFEGQAPPMSYEDEKSIEANDGITAVEMNAGLRDDNHPNPWYNQDFDGYRVQENPMHTKRPLRVLATGAGPAGLQIAYKIGKLMDNVDLVIYEKNDDVGGTWLENKYPGCACDIPSHAYQFYWNRNADWSSL